MIIVDSSIDIVFFDAFGPKVQQEVWTIDVLKKMHDMLKPNGILVTYCAMGQMKRDLKSLGFKVEGLPGPPGKREMTRAVKLWVDLSKLLVANYKLQVTSDELLSDELGVISYYCKLRIRFSFVIYLPM